MQRLAIISTHPIQYNAPWFAKLAKEEGVQLKVFYTWSQKEKDNYDPDFKQTIEWDIPLLQGYDYTFVPNTAKTQGAHHYKGIICPNLIAEIQSWQATHVLVFGWNYHAHFKAMRYFKGKIPVLFRGDSTLLDYDIKNLKSVFTPKQHPTHLAPLMAAKQYAKFKLRQAVLSLVYRYVDKAFYVGINNKAYFLAHGLKEEQLVFVPHAIDNERFFDSDEKQYESKALQWREQLGIKKEDQVILFAGKFEPRKNLLFFVKAFNEFCENNSTRIKLIILGNGPQEGDLMHLISQNATNIIRLPFQNQSMMPIVYRLANYYCLPSGSETWGLAINEALACGRPVLVSDKVGCAIDLVNPKTGIIFKNNDSKALQTALLNLKMNTPQWNASEWSFQRITDSIVDLLKKHQNINRNS